MDSVQPLVAQGQALHFDTVVIATSAGGIKALQQLLVDLPANFAAAIIIVVHLDPTLPSLLPRILSRMTPLPVKDAEAGETIQKGTIYTAPPDCHLLVTTDGILQLSQREKVNFTRPAADCTLQSVAKAWGDRAIAVILTGKGRDGTVGVQAIKQHGGRVIVQDPATAAFASMPQSAINTHQVDWVLPIEHIAPALINLIHRNGE